MYIVRNKDILIFIYSYKDIYMFLYKILFKLKLMLMFIDI